MWPILLLMIIAWGIAIERVIYLKKAGIDKEKLLSLLKSQIMAGNIQGAVKVCSGNPTPVTRIIQSGLTKFNRPDAEVQAAMDEQALKEIPKLEARTGYLAMLGNVATLVGLLGTILGLIHSFAGVAGVDPSMKATLLAKGISEAMNCTAFGLIVAIPALFLYAIIQSRTQHTSDAINECVVTEINLVLANRAKLRGQAMELEGGNAA